MRSDCLLHIYSGRSDGLFWEVDPEKFPSNTLKIGNRPDADINLPGLEFEGSGVLLESEGGNLVLNDVSGKNNLMVRSAPARRTALKVGEPCFAGVSEHMEEKAVFISRLRMDYPEPQFQYALRKETALSIGREQENGVRYNDGTVSGVHCRITWTGSAFLLEDTKSKNGTFVNGRRVKSHSLSEGNTISIFGHKITYAADRIVVGKDAIVTGLEPALSSEKANLSGPPEFQRSPRIFPVIPDGEIQIPLPPAKTEKQAFNWIYMLPSGGMLLTAVIVAASNSGSYSIISFIMAGMSIVTAVATYLSQNKAADGKVSKRAEDYSRILKAKGSEIAGLKKQQQNSLLALSPGLDERLNIINELKRRLWERMPSHEDFLSVRLGLGPVPFSVSVKLTGNVPDIYDDALLKDAVKLVEESQKVDQSPVCLSLRDYPVVGVIGERNKALQMIRAMLTDIAVHHAYDEVKLVIVYPQTEAAEWASARWLPHLWNDSWSNRFMACDKQGVQKIFSALDELFQRRKASLKDNESNISSLPHYIFVISDQHLVQNEHILEYLLSGNTRLGVSSLLLFNQMENLPRNCSAILSVTGQEGKLLFKDSKGADPTFKADFSETAAYDQFTRAMAPVRIKALFEGFSLPRMLSFYEMLGINSAADFTIADKWRKSDPSPGLSAPVGIGDDGQLFEMRIGEVPFFGVHGLVAGTNGSGKSEFLQTLILSLALKYTPEFLSIVMIDYKGGATANQFKNLPHVAGVLDNIGGSNQTNTQYNDATKEILVQNLSLRVLKALEKEMTRREGIFAKAGVDNITKYQKLMLADKVNIPLPHLLVVVDEFAILKSIRPEFMDNFVTIGQKGRSLGIKLILATQRPTGIINEQLKANIGYYICLRVQSGEDSREMLGVPDASYITAVGRGFLKAGEKGIFRQFQTAWAGAKDTGHSTSVEEILEVAVDGRRYPVSESIYEQTAKQIVSQLAAVVEAIHQASTGSEVKPALPLWSPPLPESITLEKLEECAATGERVPMIGLVDDIYNQKQFALRVNFIKEGNLAIYGGPASGKTTLLQTLLLSMARNYSPDDFAVFILDFGAYTLKLFSGMPIVSGVVTSDEAERVRYLFRFIIQEIDRRRKVFSDAEAASLEAYRELTGKALPAILLLIDNYPSMKDRYPEQDDFLQQIAREGNNAGVYLAFTTGSASTVPYRMKANLPNSIALRLVDESEYRDIVGPGKDKIPLPPFAGRGLVALGQPLEFQTALPVTGANEAEKNTRLKAFIRTLQQQWPEEKRYVIPELPDILTIGTLSKMFALGEGGKTHNLPVGISTEDMMPVSQNLIEDRNLIVFGNNRAVNTKNILMIGKTICANMGGASIELFLMDTPSGGLMQLKDKAPTSQYASSSAEAEGFFKALQEAIDRQTIPENKDTAETRIYLIIGDLAWFQHNQLKFCPILENLIRREQTAHLSILAGGLASDLTNAYDGPGKAMRDSQCGICLMDPADQSVLQARASTNRADRALKAGEAFYIFHGSTVKVKIPQDD